MSKHTHGPWIRDDKLVYAIMHAGWRKGEELFKNRFWTWVYFDNDVSDEEAESTCCLIAAAPTQHEEMLRYLPIIERAEADPELWERLTAGTGIATANGYRAAIAKATGGEG